MLLQVKRVISATLGELPIKENGGKFKPSGFKRETQGAEVAENIDYTETPTHAELVVTLNASTAIDVQAFGNLSEDTLTIFLSGGQQHVMPNAWCTEMPNVGNGEYEATFHSAKSQRLV